MKVAKLAVGLLIAGLLGGGLWYWKHSQAPDVSYTTAPVTRGDILATIGATGTVEPEETVDVGAQVAGRIIAFGTDRNGKPVDYGSEIEADTVLARIDDSMYAADAAQSTAQLQQAKAAVAAAAANLVQLQAKLEQASNDWTRAQKIGPSDALAQSSYDAYKAAFDGATANVTAGEAAILQAQASVAQAEAATSRAQLNLGYCVIKAPVKGVIIDRRVNIGQTVVASLNAPSLFLIAKDLKRMQVWVAVNEADIGSIKPGQPVTFTVDAYPGQTFHGEVGKVRLNAAMTQNVVTYTVEVVTDNSNGKLLPYLTANAQFEVDHREGVLSVPNAALRWTPLPEQIAPDARQETTVSGGSHSAGGTNSPSAARGQGKWAGHGAGRGAGHADAGGAAPTHGTVWVQDGRWVRPIHARIGITDGTTSEVQSEQLREGLPVIISESSAGGQVGHAGAAGMAAGASPGASASATTNPFVPQMPNRRH